MAIYGWIVTALIALTLLLFIAIVWIRQDFAIARYWTAKQEGAIDKRKRPGNQNSSNQW